MIVRRFVSQVLSPLILLATAWSLSKQSWEYLAEMCLD
jgi:hypothetical protein